MTEGRLFLGGGNSQILQSPGEELLKVRWECQKISLGLLGQANFRSSFLLVGDDVFQWTNAARGLIIEPSAYLGRFETGSRDGLAGSVEDPARLIHVHRTSR